MRKKNHIWEAMIAVVVTLAVILPGSAIAANNETFEKATDGLDQSQEIGVEGIFLAVGRITIPDIIDLNFQVAQSFIPQKPILTRIELSVVKNATASYPLLLGIRDELTNPDLITTSVEPEVVTTDNFSWVEFLIPDLWVTVGQTYYMVCYTENTTDNFYGWAANNDSESYPHGCAWLSADDGDTWSNDSVSLELKNNQHTNPKDENTTTWDMVFRTYGIDATQLLIERQPGITGKFVIKNVGNVIAYDVEATLQINGGIFNRINSSFTQSSAALAPNETLVINIPSLIGFGPVSIQVMAQARNTEDVSFEANGILIIIFLIILSG